MLRLPRMKPPCSTCGKVPESIKKSTHPALINKRHAMGLSEQNRLVFQHYLECAAVGKFPDDPIVARHAMILKQLEKDWQRLEQTKERIELAKLLQLARR